MRARPTTVSNIEELLSIRQPKCVVDSTTEGSLASLPKSFKADEIRTFAGNKKTSSWVFVTVEVWSLLWPSTVTGRRSYRNTHALFRDLSRRMNFERLPLIVTDGFEFYQKVIRRFVSFRQACLRAVFFGVWVR